MSKVFADCEPCDKEEALDIAVTTIKELPSAEPQGEYNRGYCDAVQGIADEMVKQGKHIEQNRPKGDVDAVAILMREMHNLEQGYITIGEFDERIEPLRHLCYGRPQDREQFGKSEQLKGKE